MLLGLSVGLGGCGVYDDGFYGGYGGYGDYVPAYGGIMMAPPPRRFSPPPPPQPVRQFRPRRQHQECDSCGEARRPHENHRIRPSHYQPPFKPPPMRERPQNAGQSQRPGLPMGRQDGVGGQ
jgi:hypothetical protein